MKILITGISGFLGRHLLRSIPDGVSVLGCYGAHPVPPENTGSARLDLTDNRSVDAVLDAFDPDTVIHTAARGGVSVCETDPALARKVNAAATAHLSLRCRQRQVRLIHISTDMVFDGEKQGPYDESDAACPVTIYGRTKWEAEQAVGEICDDATILRSALMVGKPLGSPQIGFLYWMKQAAAAGRVPLFSDQVRSPVFVGDVCDIIWRMAARPLPGLFHVGGPDCLTRVQMGRRFLPLVGMSTEAIVPTKIADVRAGYRLQRNLCMDSAKIAGALGFAFTPFDRAMRQSL